MMTITEKNCGELDFEDSMNSVATNFLLTLSRVNPIKAEQYEVLREQPGAPKNTPIKK